MVRDVVVVVDVIVKVYMGQIDYGLSFGAIGRVIF